MSTEGISSQGEINIVIDEPTEQNKGKPKEPEKTTENEEARQAKLEERKRKFEKKKGDIAINLEGLTKDTERRQLSMEKGNDRTQLATASSMFIIHVGILRTVVNAESVEYYDIQVGLVVTALMLQLVGGLLAVYITIIRNYYNEHHGDCSEDCFKICIPCSCVPRAKWKKQKSLSSSIEIWLQDVKPERDQQDPSQVVVQETESSSKCPTYHCLCHQYEPEERELLTMYKKWKDEVIKCRIRAVVDDDEEEHRDMLDLQVEILACYVQELRKNKILRRATFWQNVMQVVVFFVFIFNALFTGFGLIQPGGAV